MTYFAQLENDLVLQVRVVEQSFIDENPERYPGTWVEVFLNSDDVRLVAAPGYTYDIETGYFSPPKPFPSWVFDSDAWAWSSPVAMPDDEEDYTWDEELQKWTAVENETL